MICAYKRIHQIVAFSAIRRSHNVVLSPRKLSAMSSPSALEQTLLIRQLFEKESSTYTYLLADMASPEKDAVLIDPVVETAERDFKMVTELKLSLKWVINTHLHADHISGTGKLKAMHHEWIQSSASKQIPCKSMISDKSGAQADVLLKDNDLIKFGSRFLKVISTPGHTEGCVSYLLDDQSAVFTGDALLIRGCGRTDFQGGSASILYDSVHGRILNALPGSCIVYPAHDYMGRPCSTINEEKNYNPRLTKPKEEFIQIMNNLNLPKPKQIDRAVPANLKCGVF